MKFITKTITNNSYSVNHKAHSIGCKPHITSSLSKQATFYSSSSKVNPPPPPKTEKISDIVKFLGTLSIRIAAGISIAHFIDEYGFCFTLCEGPSMMPTIHPKGEIILIERISHRLYGLDGGYSCDQRVFRAREKQDAWEKQEKQNYQNKIEKQKRSGGLKVKENDIGNEQSVQMKEENDIHTPTWHQTPRLGKQSTLEKIKEKLSTGVHVGDVVVVQHPLKDGTVCKRVIGLPGDIIVKSHEQEHERYFTSLNYDKRNGKKLSIVPDGQIWIEGDNTPNSSDSRNYGAVPAALIVGKVVCRVWPLRGNASMERGERPMPPKGKLFTGSMAIPAGYEGEMTKKHHSM